MSIDKDGCRSLSGTRIHWRNASSASKHSGHINGCRIEAPSLAMAVPSDSYPPVLQFGAPTLTGTSPGSHRRLTWFAPTVAVGNGQTFHSVLMRKFYN